MDMVSSLPIVTPIRKYVNPQTLVPLLRKNDEEGVKQVVGTEPDQFIKLSDKDPQGDVNSLIQSCVYRSGGEA
jgi:hypothetical protein